MHHPPHPTIHRERFGHLADGSEITAFTLTNRHGLRARVCDFGALLLSMEAPDRTGQRADLTLGFDALEDWLDDPHYFGASVGRFGNRIGNGEFPLDGTIHRLATNNAPAGIPCHLHGGQRGFNKHRWNAAMLADGVEFTRQSPDGEEGYPGNLDVKITYRLTERDELIWLAEATTDRPTPVNLIHHSYWNLGGDPRRPVLDHRLMMAADHYLPTTAGLIPTGEIAPVAGTPMDFTTATALGARIDEDFEPLHRGNGYDHAWVLRPGSGVRRAALLHDPGSGRTLEILTDQPAIHVYTSNFIGAVVGKNGVAYPNRAAVCLETEAYPDAPNHHAFPNCILRPGETYRHTLVHRFSTD